MSSSITHRGPEDDGSVIRDGVGLAMRRLEIIDLAGGHQPIHNEDETVWIVFNGEIYNYLDVSAELAAKGHRSYTKSDTEVVVHAYEEWGEGCLDRLNGMFGFAIWDSRKRRLLLARDRMGIKPLYYRLTDERLAFGSEIKALLADPEVPREIDLAALDQYLAMEYVPSPRSIFKGISKLPPGHFLSWDQESGRARIERYWNVDLRPSEESGAGAGKSDDEHAAELRSVLKASVRRELISDVPLGVFLSGGIDSSAVAAMMSELTPGNVSSFSIGFNDPSFDESVYARQVAKHLGTNHHELVLEAHMMSDLVPTITAGLDEPLGDASIIPTYLLSQFTRSHVKVALGGDGGDELFAGYPTVAAHRIAGRYNRLPAFIRHGLVAPVVNRLPVSLDNLSFDYRAKRFVSGADGDIGSRHLRWLGSFDEAERGAVLAAAVREQLATDPTDDIVAGHLADQDLAEPLNRVLYLDMKLYLEGDILVKLDRASMMNSLEARVPLLNVEMVEHVARLPLSMKLRGLRSKFLLKRALRDVLPSEILERKKKGFGIPVGKWIQGQLRDEFRDALHPDRVGAQGLLDPAVVSMLLDDHLAGRRDNRKQLWTLYMFERWFDNFASAASAQGAGMKSA
jgi:asparagine synthase (glutamine-hydrolysing)